MKYFAFIQLLIFMAHYNKSIGQKSQVLLKSGNLTCGGALIQWDKIVLNALCFEKRLNSGKNPMQLFTYAKNIGNVLTNTVHRNGYRSLKINGELTIGVLMISKDFKGIKKATLPKDNDMLPLGTNVISYNFDYSKIGQKDIRVTAIHNKTLTTFDCSTSKNYQPKTVESICLYKPESGACPNLGGVQYLEGTDEVLIGISSYSYDAPNFICTQENPVISILISQETILQFLKEEMK